MNGIDNITETINRLDNSIKILQGNALMLGPLANHQVYGKKIADILDKIEVQQNHLVDIVNTIFPQFQERNGQFLEEVDTLTAKMKEDIIEK